MTNVYSCEFCGNLIPIRLQADHGCNMAVDRCINRGEKLRVEECAPCSAKAGKKVQLKVFKCSVHGECVIGTELAGVRGSCTTKCKQAVWVKPPPGQLFHTYKTTAQLIEDTLNLVPRLPALSGICGVPRSGMIPASILATHLHLPLFAYDGTSKMEPCGTGARSLRFNFDVTRPVLVVDDSICIGTQMTRVKRQLGTKGFLYAGIYCNPVGMMVGDPPRPRVPVEDFTTVEFPPHHLFEWNMHNNWQTPRFAYDFDGVLCRDFTRDECADEEIYSKTLSNIEAKANRPVYQTLSLIVTARPEKYRAQTLAWLGRRAIRVEKLIMFPAQSNAERDQRWTQFKPGEFKGRPYMESGLDLFVESCRQQAVEIARFSGRPVLCTDTGEVF